MAEPHTRRSATSGAGTITLAPLPADAPIGCGLHGELELHDLVSEDGTTFAPITVTSESMGCYAG